MLKSIGQHIARNAKWYGAGGNALLWDGIMNADNYTSTEGIGKRLLLGTVNAGIGAMGGGLMANGKAVEGLGALALSPAKDLMISAIPKLDVFSDAAKKYTENAGNNTINVNGGGNTALNWVLGGVGAGALGLGAYGIHKWLQKKDEESNRQEKGHIKIRVKGKDGDPNKTMDVVLPVDSPELSPAMMEGLNMSLRRNAKEVIRANSMKRDPETGKMIDYETWKSKYGKGKTTDATGTPLMNTPSADEYSSDIMKTSFWKAASLVTQMLPENPAQTPESKPMLPTVIRKTTGPTVVEYVMPEGSKQISQDLLSKILLGEVQTPAAAQNAQSFANTGSDTPASFQEDDDDDDFGKMASQGGGDGGGGGQLPPAPTTPPDQNQPSNGLPAAGSDVKRKEAMSRLQNIFQRIQSNRQADSGMTPSGQPGRMQPKSQTPPPAPKQ